ncbi:cryptochrome circadian regulator 5 [Xiphophorus couchianus]|uniref:cryptochrome circadian regulator 5 n=1 Tax=Xiphophorus couchianus TaxID=32473 RepID=UPI001016604B|nr:cryptochrome-1-like [Xiphophorus couchianus]XP_027871896.1 cryptochrome-1-like [Xiphophorus couchianus]XP_027871897.1 cryptochrome-1-like [Xiphophorus couchianus]
MAHVCIHWFRKGLRLHDNAALMAALKDCKELYPVFILDPYLHHTQVGINRQRFLIGALKDLDCSLGKLNSRLFVLKGKPEDVFPKLFNMWNVTKLTYEYDTEPYSLRRDEKVASLAKEHGVDVIYKISHTLYNIERIIEENNGKPPLTYKRLQAIVQNLGPPKKPIPAPTLENMRDVKTPHSEKYEDKYRIPTLEELQLDSKFLGEELFPGGEQEALRRLDEHMKRTGWVCSFEKPQTSPNSLSPSTTVLSPYVTFGCLSARTFWWRLTEVYRGRKHSDPPVSLHGQLLWREFFYTCSVGIPNFNKMNQNPVCTQVDWDTNQRNLAAWREARTGFPFIDAIMTQLRQEGWIHHLARHAVACFLTRGDLWISWEEGQKVFEDLLLDGDWALNAGNWQWLSASAFFHQFFRVYSPIAFGKKTDKNGDYIKKYLPLLKKFPSQYIYEPWKAPRSVQQAAGCIVGKDYPNPIVQHEQISKKNIQRMKEAYAKRSSDNNESPIKKQGVKRKTPSVIDMLQKKIRKE